MELRQLIIFRVAATHLSFSRAAVELNYVQSNVTTQIQVLEEELGVRLFDRLGRRIASWEILPMGKIFVPLLSSSVGACCRFFVRFTLMADTREVPSLFARSGKIAHEGSGKGGCWYRCLLKNVFGARCSSYTVPRLS